MTDDYSDFAIAAAAKAYVEALEKLAAVRQERGYCDIKDFQTREGSTGFRIRVDRAIQEARAARKRTLQRLKRAVNRCRPLPGQKVLFDRPAEAAH